MRNFRKIAAVLALCAAILGLALWMVSSSKNEEKNTVEIPTTNGNMLPEKVSLISSVGVKGSEPEKVSECSESPPSVQYLNTLERAETKRVFRGVPVMKRFQGGASKLAAASGIAREVGLEFDLSYRRRSAADILNNPTSPKNNLPIDRLAKLINLIESGKFTEVAGLFSSGGISTDSYVLSETLLTTILELAPEIHKDDLDELIAAGLSVQMSDLVFATRSRLSVEVLKVLVSHTESDFRIIWNDKQTGNSLVSIAVESLNIDALRYWLAEGVPYYVESQHLNALDHIPQVKTSAEQEMARFITDTLLQEGIAKIEEAVALQLMQFYPKEQLPPIIPSDISDPELLQAIDKLHKISTKYDSLKAHTKAFKEKCGQVENSEKKLETDDYYARLNASDIHLNTEPQALRERYFDSVRTLKSQPDSYLRKVREMFAGPGNTDWEHAINAAEQLAEDSPDYSEDIHNILLLQAVSRGENLEKIELLLDKGARFTGPILMIAVAMNRLDLLQYANEKGANIHYVGPQGRNLLSVAVRGKGRLSLIHWLLRNEVSTKPTLQGMDALNFALQFYALGSGDITSIKALIAYGVVVEKSHLQQVELLRIDNKESYQALIAEVPVLAAP